MYLSRKVFLSCVLIIVFALFVATTAVSSSGTPAILPPPEVKIVGDDDTDADPDKFRRNRKNSRTPTGKQYRQEQYHRKNALSIVLTQPATSHVAGIFTSEQRYFII